MSQNLKFDLKLHVTQFSTCIDYCSTSALSDQKDTVFKGKCDHLHTQTCLICRIITKFFGDIIKWHAEGIGA